MYPASGIEQYAALDDENEVSDHDDAGSELVYPHDPIQPQQQPQPTTATATTTAPNNQQTTVDSSEHNHVSFYQYYAHLDAAADEASKKSRIPPPEAINLSPPPVEEPIQAFDDIPQHTNQSNSSLPAQTTIDRGMPYSNSYNHQSAAIELNTSTIHSGMPDMGMDENAGVQINYHDPYSQQTSQNHAINQGGASQNEMSRFGGAHLDGEMYSDSYESDDDFHRRTHPTQLQQTQSQPPPQTEWGRKLMDHPHHIPRKSLDDLKAARIAAGTSNQPLDIAEWQENLLAQNVDNAMDVHDIHLGNNPNADPTGNDKIYVNVNDLINHIGFGRFHYRLIFLCGLGYVADNMWGEAISLIIGPVQNEWKISNMHIGWFAAFLFLGMSCGSLFWGRFSDVVGRRKPFALTLAIGGIGGMLLAFAGSYGWALALSLFLGFGVGGNIPVDGAILAEFLPFSHRGRILVSLSYFWAFGDVLACVLAWRVVPDNICPSLDDSDINWECTSDQNLGWRYLVFILGAINCSMLVFRLGANESPNFLITQGEGGRARALDVLKRMAETNGCPEKVTDNMILQVDNPMVNRKLLQQLKARREQQSSVSRIDINDMSQSQMNPDLAYANMAQLEHVSTELNLNIDLDLEKHKMSTNEIFAELFSSKPRNLRRTTPLLWMSWFFSSFGLTMFGVFLPKFLESKDIHLSSIYGDALIFAAASAPGPIVGAYMVETQRFGRRYTMTIAAALMSVFLLLFIFAQRESEIIALACLIGFWSQVFYAGLMCFTPEAYPTEIRTTAAGLSTGIRHLANIFGPVVGGRTFGDGAITLCVLSLVIASVSTFCLPFDTRKKRLVPTVRLSV